MLTQVAVAQSKLSKAVFDSPYAEAAFDEVVSKHAIDMTKFGLAILQSKRSPEKVGLACTLFPTVYPVVYIYYILYILYVSI